MMFLILNTSPKNKLPKKTTSKKFKAMYGYAADRLKRVRVKIQEIAATKAKEKQSIIYGSKIFLKINCIWFKESSLFFIKPSTLHFKISCEATVEIITKKIGSKL